MTCTTSSSLMKDTHCSHKPLAELCEPQKEARKNVPLTEAAQRGFTCQQFPHHCRISAKCHRHKRLFLLKSDKLGQKTEREIPVLGMWDASLSIYYFQQEQCVPQTGNFQENGKMKRSVARELHIKCVYIGTLSWSFLLQEKKLKYFNMILPWEGKITNIWRKILK